jgi:hypothetical protein
MDKEERAKRLRKAFRVNGGIPFPAGRVHEVNRTAPIPNNGPGKPLALHFGVSLADKFPIWIAQTESLPAEQLPLKRRRKGENPLMRIAVRYPVRLFRRPKV